MTEGAAPAALPASVMVLRLAGARYGVPMPALDEVLGLPPVSPVPGTPPWVLGVVNWRGRVLATLDLRPLLGVAAPALPSSARILVLSADGVTVGLVAEAVAGVLEYDPAAVAPVPQSASPAARRLVTGSLADDHGPLALLDPAAILGLRDDLQP